LVEIQSLEPPKPTKPIKKYIPKLDDNECMILALMWDSNYSKWKNKSKVWLVMLNQFFTKNKRKIEHGREKIKQMEAEKK